MHIMYMYHRFGLRNINNLLIFIQYLEDQDLKYVEVHVNLIQFISPAKGCLISKHFYLHQERPPSLLEAIIDDAKLDLKNIPWLFLPNRKKSLVQLFHTVHSSIDTVFATPMVSHNAMTTHSTIIIIQCTCQLFLTSVIYYMAHGVLILHACRRLYNSHLFIPSPLN